MALLDFLVGKPPGPTKAQKRLTGMQAQMFEQAMPHYSSAMQWLAQNAGMPGMPASVGTNSGYNPMTDSGGGPLSSGGSANRFQGAAQPARGWGAKPTTQPMASIQPVGQPVPLQQSQAGVLPNSALGVYGQNPADVFRLQQAEEDVNRQAAQRARMLQFRLGQQGIGGSGTGAAALMQNERSAQGQFADWRRQLAISSGAEQERRMQQLLAAMGIGTGAGAQAQAQMGAQAQMAAQGQQQQMQQLMQLAMMFAA